MQVLVDFLKNLLNKTLLLIVVLVSLGFIIYGIIALYGYFIKPSEDTLVLKNTIPLFEINLKTSLRSDGIDDLVNQEGKMYYVLVLDITSHQFNYKKMAESKDNTLYVELLDSEGFTVRSISFPFHTMTKLMGNDGKLSGFSESGFVFVNFDIYSRINKIKTSWSINQN